MYMNTDRHCSYILICSDLSNIEESQIGLSKDSPTTGGKVVFNLIGKY